MITPQASSGDDGSSPSDISNLIFGSGEMADLIRQYNWASTSLGPISQWEDAHLIAVNLILSSLHPMFLFWGEDLTQFYNDGYRDTLDDEQHPLALGNRGREFWDNIWHIIGPQIDSVMNLGEAILVEDVYFPGRRTGTHENSYWTYSYTPLRNAHGVIRGTFVVCTHTTEQVLARNLVNEEKKRLADLFEQAPAFFAVLRGPQHIFEMTNRSYQELTGNRSLIGKPLDQALPEAFAQGFSTVLDEVYRTGVPYIGSAIPVELHRSSASTTELRYLDFIYQPMRDLAGTISSILVFGVDVTEGRRAEQLLLQSEKLAAVGQMASTIAHEINNPLEAVTNLLYLARRTPESGELNGYLDLADQELRRIAAISSQTLRFHKQLTKPTLTTCDALFGSSLMIFERKIENADIRVEKRKRARKGVVCYEGEIRQVLNNLIGNAIDAMPHGGRLLVRSGEVTDWKTGRHGLRLTVADTGTGIAPLVVKRIFDPFFTTKGILGTGLGLWVSQEIASRHHGSLSVRSSENETSHGTVFSLFLPFDAVTR